MKAPKEIANKLSKSLEAWQDLAPEKSFAGMSLADFKTRVQPSLDSRDLLRTVASQRVEAQTRREESDDASLRLLQLVVNSIKGDPTEGEDSALYQACGYIRKSARKSGLSRKNKSPQPEVKAA